MWDLPRPGIEPVSPALAGGFLTTDPPGKSRAHFPLSINLPSLLVFWIFFFFWPCHAAHGILVPQLGIEAAPPAMEVQSLNHWTAGEVLVFWLI